jgi:hypothetical protein
MDKQEEKDRVRSDYILRELRHILPQLSRWDRLRIFLIVWRCVQRKRWNDFQISWLLFQMRWACLIYKQGDKI